MSADPDKDTACPQGDIIVARTDLAEEDSGFKKTEKKEKPARSVCFPDDHELVTQYFEPANPWHDVPATSRSQLVAEYLDSCRRHRTEPIDCVLLQIRELPENAIGGSTRASRLVLADCLLVGTAPTDALEAVFSRVQFRRLEIDHVELDDEGAEALFDMIEYYESAVMVSIRGPRLFGIRGWQAVSRMIRKSAELSELEVLDGPLETAHAHVASRALRPNACRLRTLCLQRVALSGDPLFSLVLAMKSNVSLRELRLPDNDLIPSDAQQLATLLRLNTHIQLLDLSNNMIQDAGVAHIADALVKQSEQTPPSAGASPLSPHHYPLGVQETRGLAVLVLWNNYLTDNCAHHLSTALRSSRSLCVLNIGRNALGCEAARAISRGAALLSLGLQCSQLGPEAACALADRLRQDETLQRLDLRDNRLGVAGLQAILSAMQENTTLTQIDLDDPEDTTTLSENSEAATIARLTRDIRAACRGNEPPPGDGERRAHRKISLTCHTQPLAKWSASQCGGRLRSPAPSPAHSPTPLQHTTRFSVTRVTPERESSNESSPSTPPRPSSCPSPSRFKVMQVIEPPQIQVQPVQKRSSSRFSVTRNYDSIYNPSPPSLSPTPSLSPVPSPSPTVAGSVTEMTSPVITLPPVISEAVVMVNREPKVVTSQDNKVLDSQDRSLEPKVMGSQETMVMTSEEYKVIGSQDRKVLNIQAPMVMTSQETMVLGSEDPKVMASQALMVLASQDHMVLASQDHKVMARQEHNIMTSQETLVMASQDSKLMASQMPMVMPNQELVMACQTPMVMTSQAPRVMASQTPMVMASQAAMVMTSQTALVTTIQEPMVMTSQAPMVMASQVPMVTKSYVPEVMTSQTPKVLTGQTHMVLTSQTPNVLTGQTAMVLASQAPTILSGQTPIVLTGQTPLVLTSQTPMVLASQAPTVLTGQIPVVLTSETPNVLTSQTPAVLTGQTPMVFACQAPTVLTGQTPVVLTGQKPKFLTGQTSEVMTLSTTTETTKSSPSVPIQNSAITNKFPVVSSVLSAVCKEQAIMTDPLSSVESKLGDFQSRPEYLGQMCANVSRDSYSAIVPECVTNKNVGVNVPKINESVAVSKNVVSGVGMNESLDKSLAKSYVEVAKSEPFGQVCGLSEAYVPNVGTNVGFDRTINVKKPLDPIVGSPSPLRDLKHRAVPNTRFSVSPTPDKFGMFNVDESVKGMVKPIAIGSQTSVAVGGNDVAMENNRPKEVVKLHEIHIEESVSEAERTSISGSHTEHNNTQLPFSVPVSVNVSRDTGLGNTGEMKVQEIVDKSQSIEEYSTSKRLDNIHAAVVLGTESSKELIGKEISKEDVVKGIVEKNTDGSRYGGENVEMNVDSDKHSDSKSDTVRNKTYSDVVKTDAKYKDKSEQLIHSEEISDKLVKSETKLVKNSVHVSDKDKVDVQIAVTVVKESVKDAKVHSDQNKDIVNIEPVHKKDKARQQIEEITEDLGNLIKEMKDMSSKTKKSRRECTVDLLRDNVNSVPGINRDVILKKNMSESSLDSPDLEVSRLMNKKLFGSPFCDSSSSLEISGSSMESLYTEGQNLTVQRPVVIQESTESDTELDRRKEHVALSTESSMESTSDVTPVNSNLLNMSVSSNESVSPIIFGKKKKLHDSLSSLEASMSSLDSNRQEKVMVTSADSGIEYSLQQPPESKEDSSSNEGTLTHNSSLRETVNKTEQETLTSSPKRASSLLDVPALKTKGLDRMRKISFVAPSPSFHIPRLEPEKEKPSHLEKLLSLFQNPTSIFSRSQSDEERKSASNTPPRKDSSLTSSFWAWGSATEKEKEDKEDSSEATDSTLSERVQLSFVDESFSKKLDSKTPSTDTDNTLSEFQSFPTQSEKTRVTDSTTDELVQKCYSLSLKCTENTGSGDSDAQRASDNADLSKPNDLNRNETADGSRSGVRDEKKSAIDNEDDRIESIRPRSFAAVLKSSGSENSLDKQPSPDLGQSVDKLPSKVIRGIKENISPENTLTSSMTNTKTLATELSERQVKSQVVVGTIWDITNPLLEKIELNLDDLKTHSDLAPIATIEETCDESADNTVNIPLEFIDDVKIDDTDVHLVTYGPELEPKAFTEVTTALENVDFAKDALSYLIYESQDLEPETEQAATRLKVEESSLAQELKEAEIKEMLDLSPELVIDTLEVPEVFVAKEMKKSPAIPERAKLKKSNSLEDLSKRIAEEAEKSPKTKTIAFKVPETSPRDIPERGPKLRTMSGSSPKSLPESLNKPSPLTKMDALRKRKKISSLGKIAKDSLLALNMSEEEIAEYRRSYVTSVESLRSLESVSEDANSQSGTSFDSRCRVCLRTSQESLMSLDSITDECRCADTDKPRSAR